MGFQKELFAWLTERLSLSMGTKLPLELPISPVR
jgi:hypothetical protein